MIGLALLAILFFFLFARNHEPSNYTGKRKKDWCPPHTWQWNEEGRLQCTTCQQFPDYQGRE